MTELKEMADALGEYLKEKESCKYKSINPEICMLLGSKIWHTCRIKTKKETDKCPLKQMSEMML